MLIAFFIVLNSISWREDVRTAAAINSLTATFRVERPISDEVRQFSSTPASLDPVEEFQRRVRSIFERELRVARFDIVQRGNAMRVTIPNKALFAPREARLRPERAAVLDAIADALGRVPADQHFRVEFIVGSGLAPPSVESRPGLATRRSGVLAYELGGRGVGAAQLAAGVASGPPAVVQMIFSGRRGNEPKVTFQHLVN